MQLQKIQQKTKTETALHEKNETNSHSGNICSDKAHESMKPTTHNREPANSKKADEVIQLTSGAATMLGNE